MFGTKSITRNRRPTYEKPKCIILLTSGVYRICASGPGNTSEFVLLFYHFACLSPDPFASFHIEGAGDIDA
jgi:hypothetical protein